MERRTLLGAMLGATLSVTAAAAAPTDVEVWKDPQCGCCKDWVAHLQDHGFRVKVHDGGNTEARKRMGLPDTLAGCHTAQVNGYLIEGHVPARDIQRLLRDKPRALGLAVPGMPVGSPGMDGAAYGGRHDRFDVLLVSSDRRTSVYQTYP